MQKTDKLDADNLLFTRGAEVEIQTMQEVEQLKAHLAREKIHIPTEALEKGIIMPKDVDTSKMTFPRVEDLLMVNPYVKQGKSGKTKKAKGKKGGKKAGKGVADMHPLIKLVGGKLIPTDKGKYKLYEFGNFPL